LKTLERPVANTKGLLLAALCSLGLFSGLIGCGPSEETAGNKDSRLTDNSASTPERNGTKQKNTQRFTVRADTLHATSRKRDSTTAAAIEIRNHTPKKYYSVQIGAFKSENNVKQNQTMLEKRFQKPVITFFDKGISLTRICIGKFSSEEAAWKFLRTMQEQFPNDYKQAWVAALKQ
jgi:cell division septation protein DedD